MRPGLAETRAGDDFLLLRTISYFTYEMVNNTEKIAKEGDFRKRRTGCPLLPARPVGYHIPISLVKSDWKLQQKIVPRPRFSQPRPHFVPSVEALIKIDFRQSCKIRYSFFSPSVL